MSPVKGKCLEMCPIEEKTMRTSQKLVHQLERDRNTMVKCFRRSAAGRSLNNPNLLRPPSVLKNTVSYLLNDILTDTKTPFNIVYDFIDNRLNAIRQDATIQEVSDEDWLVILPPIIKFHAYAAYKCYEYDINTYDPFLNMKQFNECILKVIKILLDDTTNSNDQLCSEMVSLFIVANLGDYHVLQQTLPFIPNKSTLIKKAMLLSLNIMNGNFEELCKTYHEFPVIHQCIMSVHLPILRKFILKSMCMGFNCKNNYFPISILTRILLHNEDQETINECKHYCLKMVDDKVELSKSFFSYEVDEFNLKKKIKFNENISTIILNV